MTIQVFNDMTSVYTRHDPEPSEYVGELWQFTGHETGLVTLPDQIELRGLNGVIATYTLVKEPS